MTPYVILLLEFLLIFLTSRYIFQSFFNILFRVTKSQKFSFSLLSLFFFPGTFIHEVSHMVVAMLLRVRTYGMEFTPEYSEGGLKMGSVKLQKSDLIRSMLIGGAPFVVGVLVLILILGYVVNTYSIQDVFSSWDMFGLTLLISYILFVVTNTMFSSKKDMDGIWLFVVTAILAVIVLYLFKVNVLYYLELVLLQNIFVNQVWFMIKLLCIPLFINIIVLSISKLITR